MDLRRLDLLGEFNRVYGDLLVDPDDDHARYEQAIEDRSLQWRAEKPIPLMTAAFFYSQLPDCEGWRSCLLPHLLVAFPDDNIRVTPGREYSVCMYIHVHAGIAKKVEDFVRANFEADEMDWKPSDSGSPLDQKVLRVWWD